MNAADSRESHTPLWTGTEMIVWGGYNSNGALNTGGRYNPAADNWIPTSTATAPGPRRYHTAVWTGFDMIVWGGDFGGLLNTGGRYNPNTDTWITTSLTNAPVARDNHTGVWTGSQMIIWGGEDDSFSFPRAGGKYNPVTDSWTATTDIAPDGRMNHSAVWIGTQMIVWAEAPMAQMLIPADAIAQKALRSLRLLQNQHLVQQLQAHPDQRLLLVPDQVPTPGQV